MILLDVILHLVIFHSVDGHEIALNPKQVTSMVTARDDEKNKLFTESVRCLINLADGKYITVAESCDEARHKLENAK